MNKPNLLAIWAKHERGESATNEELGHLISKYDILLDDLERANAERDFRQQENKELFDKLQAVRELAETWHVDAFAYDTNPLNGTLTINVSDAAKHVARALDGEQA